jgi:hypothetical protein
MAAPSRRFRVMLTEPEVFALTAALLEYIYLIEEGALREVMWGGARVCGLSSWRRRGLGAGLWDGRVARICGSICLGGGCNAD